MCRVSHDGDRDDRSVTIMTPGQVDMERGEERIEVQVGLSIYISSIDDIHISAVHLQIYGNNKTYRSEL